MVDEQAAAEVGLARDVVAKGAVRWVVGTAHGDGPVDNGEARVDRGRVERHRVVGPGRDDDRAGEVVRGVDGANGVAQVAGGLGRGVVGPGVGTVHCDIGRRGSDGEGLFHRERRGLRSAARRRVEGDAIVACGEARQRQGCRRGGVGGRGAVAFDRPDERADGGVGAFEESGQRDVAAGGDHGCGDAERGDERAGRGGEFAAADVGAGADGSRRAGKVVAGEIGGRRVAARRRGRERVGRRDAVDGIGDEAVEQKRHEGDVGCAGDDRGLREAGIGNCTARARHAQSFAIDDGVGDGAGKE